MHTPLAVLPPEKMYSFVYSVPVFEGQAVADSQREETYNEKKSIYIMYWEHFSHFGLSFRVIIIKIVNNYQFEDKKTRIHSKRVLREINQELYRVYRAKKGNAINNYTYSNNSDLLSVLENGSGTDYTFTSTCFGQTDSVAIGSRTLVSNSYSNDGNRNLTQVSYGNGDTVSYSYDSHNRVTGTAYGSGTMSYATAIGGFAGFVGGAGADGQRLRGVANTARSIQKSAVSPKKIAMYVAKEKAVYKKAAISGLKTVTSGFVGNGCNYIRQWWTGSAT